MRSKIVYILYSIGIFIASSFLLFAALGAITFLKTGDTDNMQVLAALSLAPALCLAISITGIVRYHSGYARTVAVSVLLKIAALLISFGVLYLTPALDTMVAPFLCFTGIGIFVAVMALALAHDAGPKKPIAGYRIKFSGKPGEVLYDGYSARVYCHVAGNEYREKIGKGNPTEEQLCDYASMPVVYLLCWLLSREYMSSSFYEKQSKDEVYDYLKYHTPLEFFRDYMDYDLCRDDINEDILAFLDKYCVECEGKPEDGVFYSTDYYNAIKNSTGRYYCLEYSDDTYNRLQTVFDNRLSSFRGK